MSTYTVQIATGMGWQPHGDAVTADELALLRSQRAPDEIRFTLNDLIAPVADLPAAAPVDVTPDLEPADETAATESAIEEPRDNGPPHGVRVANIPESLKSRDSWITWRERNGRKPPCDKDGRVVDGWQDRLLPFVAAMAQLAALPIAPAPAGAHPAAGLGLYGATGIDCDNCFGEDGVLDPRAQVVLDTVPGYAERSPSGQGFKIFCRVDPPRWLEIDFKSSGDFPRPTSKAPGYFAVTGNAIRPGDAAADGTDALAKIEALFGQGLPGVQTATEKQPPIPADGSAVMPGSQEQSMFREACALRRRGHTEKGIADALWALVQEGRFPNQPGREPWTYPDCQEKARSASRYAAGLPAERRLTLTPASEIQPRRVRWAWANRMPLGMLSLIAGREAGGKSSVAYERAARVTRGQLEGDLFGTPRGVIVVASEDSWEHTIVPRLMAAGADLTRVFRATVNTQDYDAFELSLPDDIPALEAAIAAYDVALIILDPVISRLSGKLDTHKDADVRLALEPIVGLANRTGATVVGIIHVNKTSTTDPLTAIMGSRAFPAVARAVLFVLRDGDSRLLCFPKSNLGPEQKSMSFRIQSREVARDDDGEPITTGEVVWTGEVERTAREVLEEQAGGRPRSTRDKAEDFLSKRLANGAASSKDLRNEAEAAGIPFRTVQRAAREMCVVITTGGFPPTSTWSLPDVEM